MLAPIAVEGEHAHDHAVLLPPASPTGMYVTFSCGRRDVTDNENDVPDLNAKPPRRIQGPIYGPMDYAQLTYETLNFGPNGEQLAAWSSLAGDWVITQPGSEYDDETYSDITIFHHVQGERP